MGIKHPEPQGLESPMTRRVPCLSDAEDAVRTLLEFIGDDPDRPDLKDTPKRVCSALVEMTGGMTIDVGDYLQTTFDVDYDEMVVCTNIRFTSICEHHLLPFSGVAAVGYVPDKKVVGLSKLPRTVLAFARRPQVQERMTIQIADAISFYVKPKGVGVIVKAHHSCMGCRGVRQPDAEMITSAMRGVMLNNPEARDELLRAAKM